MGELLNVRTVAVGAIVTTIISLLGTWIYTSITDEPRGLQYRLTTSPPLPGRLANHTVYTVVVSNPGETESKSVRFEMKFPGGEIREKSIIAPQAMEYKETISAGKDSYLLTTPILNPKDEITISFYTRYAQPQRTPPTPTIGLRAEGLNGVLAKDAANQTDRLPVGWLIIVPLVAGAITSVVVLALIFRRPATP